MGHLTVLEDKEQLLELALLIKRHEVEAIHGIEFGSEHERVKYLHACNSNYESVKKLLAAAEDAKDEAQDDEAKAAIAHDIYTYTVNSLNIALQTVGNYYLRMHYLEKIKNHADELLEAVGKLDPKDVTKAEDLAKEATHYKDAADKFLDKYQSGASKEFADKLKGEGTTFEELVEKYKKKLHFQGEFEHLKDEEKILVYNEIMEESGRGQIISGLLDKVSGAAGTAVLFFTLGIMVWDIYSSAHPLDTAAKDAAMAAASVDPAAIMQVVEAVAATLTEEAEISTVFVAMAGMLSGIAEAAIIAAVAGAVVYFIFASGGKKPTHHIEVQDCYVSQMPDGPGLARQLLITTSNELGPVINPS